MAIVVCFLVAGLYPFNFFPENQVSILPSGYFFDGRGVVMSESPVSPEGDFSLEMLITPVEEPSCHLARIFSLVDAKNREVLSLSQWKSLMEIGVRPGRKIGIRDALFRGRTVYVSLTFKSGEGTIILDGGPGKKFRLGDFRGAISPQKIILGNSANGQNFWRGKIEGFTCLDSGKASEKDVPEPGSPGGGYLEGRESRYYLWSEKGVIPPGNLTWVVPKIFRPIKPDLLGVPEKNDFRVTRSLISDTVINLLGFIPFGICFSAYCSIRRMPGRGRLLRRFPGSPFFTVVVSGFLISLSIELLQVLLPTRDSSLSDLVLNTAGTALGFLLFRLFLLRGRVLPAP